MQREIISLMRELGFTANESKAYLSLLTEFPATGYELSSRAGIPRSATYELLRKMEAAGVVTAVQDSPARYVPLPPEQLAASLEERFRSTLREFKRGVERLPQKGEIDTLRRVRGYGPILERARSMIQDAGASIYISCWSSEANLLREALVDAVGRGVTVIAFSFGPLSPELGQIHTYGLDEQLLEAFWTHKLILVRDREEVLMGGATDGPSTTAVLTADQEIVEIAVNNISLDITLLGQRLRRDVSEPMLEMLRERLGALDNLLKEGGS